MLVLVAAVPTVGIVVFSASAQRRLMLEQASGDTSELALLVAERGQRAVDAVRGLLTGMAQMRSIQRLEGDACSAEVAAILVQDPLLVNAGATSADGMIFCSGVPARPGIDLSDRVFYREALRTGGLGVGEYVVSRVRGTGALGFGVPVKLRPGDPSIVAVAFASLDVKALQRDLDGLELPAGAEVALLDRAGVTLSARPGGAGWLGRRFEPRLVQAARAASGPVAIAGTDGVTRLYALREVTAPDGTVAMRVLAGIPADAIVEPVNRVSSRALVGSLLASVLALAAAGLMAEFMLVRRLHRLAATSRRIAAGDLSARTGLPARRDELGELVTSFDDMARALEELDHEKRRSEERLRHVQKMDAVGQLAGGVAHDFNNLLTVILSAASALRESIPERDPRQEDVGDVMHAAERAAALTRQLLAFSRRQALAPRILNLGDTVRGMERMLQRVLGEAVSLSVDVRAAVSVFADAGQIELALLNLAVNARDAMPKGGRLDIEVGALAADDPARPEGPDVPAGPLATLTVCDTGVGIAPEIRARIFEPFFTTKAPGRGTGLGLSTVLGIVGQSGGTIRVTSAVGRGSSFVVYLPGHDVAATSSPAGARGAPQGSGETILVVEDDERLRGMLRRTLVEHGYRVLEASAPSEARAVAAGHPAPALLLTDVILPEGDGVALARELGRRWPHVPVLFMSGYAGEHLSGASALPGGARFLAKPFTPDALLGAVREALRAAPAPLKLYAEA